MAEEEAQVSQSTIEIWRKRLDSPWRMALFVMGGLTALALVGIVMPLSGQIDQANARLKKAEERRRLAADVEELRSQAALYRGRISRGADLYEWSAFLYRGARQSQVTLVSLEPLAAANVPPAKAPGWRLGLQGEFVGFGKFVDWLEHSNRLIAIESVVIENRQGELTMLLQVRELVL